MKTELLRLGSVVRNGVEGPGSGAINLIYTYLLQDVGLTKYTYIKINQIGDDLEEFVAIKGKNVFINIRYPAVDDFDITSVRERNLIRLDIIHTALKRLMEKDSTFSMVQLEEIKSRILNRDFNFEITYRVHPNKKSRSSLVAKILVTPTEDKFDFYCLIEDSGKIKCKVLIYSGKPTDYMADFFFYGKWQGDNEFTIWGKSEEVEIHVQVDSCEVRFVNLTKYGNPPAFEMMKADLSDIEKNKAYQDWLHSLPPGHSAMLNYEPN